MAATYGSEEDKSKPYVFIDDPIKLKSFVHKYVKVVTIENTEFNGYVYTVDPVTGSFMIVKPLTSSEEKMSVDVIPGCAILDVSVQEDVPPAPNYNSEIDRVFNFKSNLVTYDPVILAQQRTKILHWFQKNFIPIEQCADDPDSLVIMNSVKIMPPYGINDCYTDNEVILEKIQELLKAMPEKDTEDKMCIHPQ